MTRYNRAETPEERLSGANQVRELLAIEPSDKVRRRLVMYEARIFDNNRTA